MYGTTIRNYNSSKFSKLEERKNRNFMGKSKNNRKNKKEDFQRTRYMKIEENEASVKENEKKRVHQSTEKVSRREFPIASVIFTVVATMVLLLIGTGVMG